MLPRFFAPDLVPGMHTVTLDADETHHLVHVLRLTVGDTARVFDGRGNEWQGTVANCDKRGATIDDLTVVAPLPESQVATTLVAGLLRGSAMDDLVRDATMLGVRAIVPMYTEHCSVSRRKDAAPTGRWRRIAVTSAKQCGRAVVPRIDAPVPFEAALDLPGAVKLILAEPAAAAGAFRRVDDLAEIARAGGAVIAAGPEGGWSAAEVRSADAAGYRLWSLGTQILRAEAVPLAALSVARYAWEA